MPSDGIAFVRPVMASTETAPARRSKAAAEYPYSDGSAPAESPRHFDTVLYAMTILRNRYADSRFVLVGASMNLFDEEGARTKELVSDLFVVRVLETLPELSIRCCEAGNAPDLAPEVASPSNAERDRGANQALYASMRVAEYWRFNPVGALDGASVEGARLEESALRVLGYEPLPRDEDGSIRNGVLRLGVRVDRRRGMEHPLRLRDPETGEDQLTFRESEQGRTSAERQLQEVEQVPVSTVRTLNTALALKRDSETEVARLNPFVADIRTSCKPGGKNQGP